MSTPLSAQSPPPSPKPRKKRPVEDVSFEDLLAAHKTERGPGGLPQEGVVLIGVDLELQRRMAEGLSILGAPVADAPIIGNENIGADNLGAPNFSASDTESAGEEANIEAPKLDSANFGAPNNGDVEIEAPKFDLRELLIRRSPTKTYTIRPVSRMEDAFTAAERELFRWLWDHSRLIPLTHRLRLMTGPSGEGARRLATQAGLIYNTFKNLTRSLSTKFALDIVKPEKNLPTIYAVYEESAVLERQRRAGFTGAVHKNGGGRDLVNAQSQPAGRRPDLTIGELEEIISAQNFSAK